jgi:hypothetical protein
MTLAAVDFSQLGKVIWVSLLAGVGVPALFSIVIYASTRAAECRRDGRSGTATAFGGMAAAAMLAFTAAIVFAISIILSK